MIYNPKTAFGNKELLKKHPEEGACRYCGTKKEEKFKCVSKGLRRPRHCYIYEKM